MRPSFGRCCVAASAPRTAMGHSMTPSPSACRAIRSPLTSRTGLSGPASFIRVIAASDGTVSWANATFSSQPGPRWANPTRRHPIPIAASRPGRFTRSCAPRRSSTFRGSRRRLRPGFPGLNGWTIWAGSSVSPLSCCFACRFPAWPWRRSCRRTGSSWSRCWGRGSSSNCGGRGRHWRVRAFRRARAASRSPGCRPGTKCLSASLCWASSRLTPSLPPRWASSACG